VGRDERFWAAGSVSSQLCLFPDELTQNVKKIVGGPGEL